jgi:hypothetical protein
MQSDAKLQESFSARFCCINVTALATMIGQLRSAMLSVAALTVIAALT